MRILFATALSALALSAADNTLSPAEKKEGFRLLFDGKTFNHWRDPAKETPPGDSWAIEHGTLTTRQKALRQEDLISDKSYGDFELRFSWKVSEGGNTGLKYRQQRTVYLNPVYKGPFEAMVQQQLDQPTYERSKLAPDARGQEYTISYELQLIDDLRHPDAKKSADRTTGALYSMLAPAKHPAHPAGEWNEARLILKGTHFEHWINGELALSGTLDDPAALASLKKRWQNGPAVYDILAHAKLTGQFSLQHHGDKVWFKNIQIHDTPK
jgi:hypothetical protein